MTLRTMLLIGGLAAGLATVLSIGCKEEPKCRKACLHACEICGQPCDPSDPVVADELDVCQENCETSGVPAWRANCILDTELCEDLWKC